MLNKVFENESFIISSVYKNVVTMDQIVGYVIIPKFLNVPVINLKYLHNLNKIFKSIGIHPYQAELNELKQENTTPYKIQYFVPTLQWKNLKKALEYTNSDLQTLADNLAHEENYQQEHLFNLLSVINNDINKLYLWHGIQT